MPEKKIILSGANLNFLWIVNLLFDNDYGILIGVRVSFGHPKDDGPLLDCSKLVNGLIVGHALQALAIHGQNLVT